MKTSTNPGAVAPFPLPAESAGGVEISHAASDPRALAHPIPFSAPMSSAILAGRKTQTRRALKPPRWSRRVLHKGASSPSLGVIKDERLEQYFVNWGKSSGWYPKRDLLAEPAYAVGDRLWVREPYYQFGHWIPQGRTKTGRVKWAFKIGSAPTFAVPPLFRKARRTGDEHTSAWHARLGRFMPRIYSRLTLTVTDVRVMHLQDISEEDAEAEGAEPILVPPDGGSAPHVEGFRAIWEAINGAGAWDANPWVAAYTFSVEQKNIDE